MALVTSSPLPWDAITIDGIRLAGWMKLTKHLNAEYLLIVDRSGRVFSYAEGVNGRLLLVERIYDKGVVLLARQITGYPW